MIWRTNQHPRIPPRAFASWHSLEELELCLHYVQAYIAGAAASEPLQSDVNPSHTSASVVNPRKRKAPGVDAFSGESTSTKGLLTPVPSHLDTSRSPSLASADEITHSEHSQDWWDVQVYNGVLQRKDGWIMAKKV